MYHETDDQGPVQTVRLRIRSSVQRVEIWHFKIAEYFGTTTLTSAESATCLSLSKPTNAVSLETTLADVLNIVMRDFNFSAFPIMKEIFQLKLNLRATKILPCCNLGQYAALENPRHLKWILILLGTIYFKPLICDECIDF